MVIYTVPDEEEHQSQVTVTFDTTLRFQISHVTAEADIGGQPLPDLVIKIYTIISVLCIILSRPKGSRQQLSSKSHLFYYMRRTFSLSRLYYLIILCFSVAMIM
jgi:hypothetical protein